MHANKLAILGSLVFFSLAAAPHEPLVMHGEADFQSEANALHIRASDKAVIHWKNFSIDEHELVKFMQPSSKSVVLNRVMSGAPSEIMGRLEANGLVYLVNPNGIFVGKNAVIDTNGFFAFGFDVANDQFLEHDFGKSPLIIQPSGPSDNPFASVIRHHGKIDALKSEEKGGHIYLVANRVEAEGTLHSPQGEVQVLGNGLYFSDTSFIDVSAKESGDSGKVILIGDVANQFYGRISAQGGALSGNGGFVEVSGKKLLDYRGIANTLAPCGTAGTVLMDPTNVRISAAMNSAGVIPGPIYNIDAVAASPANISTMVATTLITQLGLSNVLISTAATPGLGDAGDITIDAAVSWASSFSLSLEADNDIIFNEAVTCTGSGGIDLLAGNDITVGSPTLGIPTGATTASGDINATAGHDINIFGGNMMGAVGGLIATTSGNVTVTAANDINLTAGSADLCDALIITDSGDVSVSDVGGDIFLMGGSFNSAGGFYANIGSVSGDVLLVRNAGTLTCQAGSDTFCFSKVGAVGGNASTSGSLIIDFEGDINILGHPAPIGGNTGAAISSSSTLTSISTRGNVLISGGGNAPGSQVVFIESSDGAFVVNVGGDLLIQGGPGALNGAWCLGYNDSVPGATTNINVDGNIILEAGPGMSSDADLGCVSNCTDPNTCSIKAGQNIILRAAPGTPAGAFGRIFTEDSSVTVRANGSIFVEAQGQIVNVPCNLTMLPMTVIAGQDIVLSGDGLIFNLQTDGAVTLIVDNNFPSSPGFGTGSLSVGPASFIASSGGPLLIFTSSQSLNTIEGTLNGAAFSPGTPYVNTATEMWGVYYPHNSGFPYTIFYKDISISGSIVPRFNIAAYEFFQTLRYYDEFGYYSKTFKVGGEQQSMVCPTYWETSGKEHNPLVE